MKLNEYLFFLACANFSFIAGFMISVSRKNYQLLIPASIAAALIFGAAYCESNALLVPAYRFAPVVGGLFYGYLAVITIQGARYRPDRRDMAFITSMVALGHFAAAGLPFYLWPLEAAPAA